jgi:hypothetical protein
MREIAQMDSGNLQKLSGGHHQQVSDSVELSQRRQVAMQEIGEQNKLAAVDSSEFSMSSSMAGSFSFSFESQVSVSWQSSASQQFSAPASFQSQFSFGFSVSSSYSVQFNEGISVSEQQISGQDFEFDRNGLLKLLEELIEMLGAQDRPEIDLSGEVDGRAMDLLEKLGLIDGEGKATMMLQAMSDFADLNRFHAGQQVRTQSGFSYSAQYSETQLGWQSWLNDSQAAGIAEGGQTGQAGTGDTTTDSGVGGANVVAGSNVDGDINIDDRDVININIHQSG